MINSATARLPNGLPAEITRSLVSVWTRYAGQAPTAARTQIRGNVVTCMLVDAVGDYDRSMAPPTRDAVAGDSELTPSAYKREAVAAVVRRTTPSHVFYTRSSAATTETRTLPPRCSFWSHRSGGGHPSSPTGDRAGVPPAFPAGRPSVRPAER